MPQTATSRAPLSFDVQSPEEQAKLQELMRIQNDLQQAMVNRRQLFDPVLLAMAQGFLAPTKTGSFGESIANAAALVGPAQAQEEKRQMEIGQIRAELARNQLEMMQQQRASQDFQKIIGGMLPTPQESAAPAQAGPSPGPLARGTAPPVSADQVPTIVGSPLAQRGESASEVIAQARPASTMQAGAPPAAATQDPNIRIFDRLRENPDLVAALANSRDPRAKPLLEAFKNYETLRIQAQATQGQLMQMEEVNVFNLGTVRLPRSVAQQYYDALSRRDTFDAIQIIRRYTGEVPVGNFGTSGNLPGALGTPVGAEIIPQQSSGAPGQPNRVSNTVEGRLQAQRMFETQQDIIKAEGIERAKAAVELENAILSAGKIGYDLARQADMLIELASNPNTKDTFGILAQSGFLGALGQVAENSLRIGSYNIGIPSIETAIRTATRTPAEIRAAEIAGTASTMLELNFRQLFLKGQGSISNMETEAVRRLAGTISDTPEGIVAKARLIKLRSEFDVKTAEIFRDAQKRGISVRDFKDTNEYKTAVKEYDEGISGIIKSTTDFRPSTGSRPPRPAPHVGSPSPAPAPAQRPPVAPAPAAPAVPPPGSLPPGFSILR